MEEKMMLLVAEELARRLQPLPPPFQGSHAIESRQGPDPKIKKGRKGSPSG